MDRSGRGPPLQFPSRRLKRTVIVAVTSMRVMQMPANQVVNMVSVRHTFLSAVGIVSVPVFVIFAVMVRRTNIRIEVAYRHGMFVDVVIVDMMQVTVVQIVRMTVVCYSFVAAAVAMCVVVVSMLFTCCLHRVPPFQSHQTRLAKNMRMISR